MSKKTKKKKKNLGKPPIMLLNPHSCHAFPRSCLSVKKGYMTLRTAILSSIVFLQETWLFSLLLKEQSFVLKNTRARHFSNTFILLTLNDEISIFIFLSASMIYLFSYMHIKINRKINTFFLIKQHNKKQMVFCFQTTHNYMQNFLISLSTLLLFTSKLH